MNENTEKNRLGLSCWISNQSFIYFEVTNRNKFKQTMRINYKYLKMLGNIPNTLCEFM